MHASRSAANNGDRRDAVEVFAAKVSRDKRPGEKRKASDAPASQEGSAFALLALMASVQQAAQASADARRRTSEAYTSWTASNAAQESSTGRVKKRKPTHTVRKEEIATLTDEITVLEKRLAFLRGKTIAPQVTRDAAQVQADPEHPSIPNALLREAIHEQQLSLACARSIITQFIASDFALPAHCYIHLTTRQKDRVRTLQAVKPQQLRMARRYLLERSRHINITKPHSAGEQFLNEVGDACNLRFSIVQLPASASVRQVFDAAIFLTSNLEISFTDGAGRLTIREDNSEIDDPALAHHRVLTTVQDGLYLESHQAMFTHYDEEDEFGIVTSTFVDRDDRHPYVPLQRLRQDITAALLVSREKEYIVMRRLGHVRIHHNPNFPIDDNLARSLSEGLSNWGDALLKHVRQQCGLD